MNAYAFLILAICLATLLYRRRQARKRLARRQWMVETYGPIYDSYTEIKSEKPIKFPNFKNWFVS